MEIHIKKGMDALQTETVSSTIRHFIFYVCRDSQRYYIFVRFLTLRQRKTLAVEKGKPSARIGQSKAAGMYVSGILSR